MTRRVSDLDRRRLLVGAAGLSLGGLAGCAGGGETALPTPLAKPVLSRARVAPIRLAPVRASPDRIFDVTVCLRPFRAEGPRLDVEEIGGARIVHNYGHGGAGWSLSWGSSTIAVQRAMEQSPVAVAVLGCGALGLTSAILAQQAGAKVTIYARELLPDTRSARATGSWTPDSRIALADKAAQGFPAVWEEMARTSFRHYRRYLGLPGSPVEWTDRYLLSNGPDDPPAGAAPPGGLDFADYQGLIRDLSPPSEPIPAEATPFPVSSVRRFSSMQFNIADYGHQLMADFLTAGGQIERRAFQSPSELAGLPEKVVINCPGYGARALWRDESIVPVRGQIAWLIPQPEVDYGVICHGVNVLARRDGIVLQMLEGGDMRGYGDANETTDPAEAREAVDRVAPVFANFREPAA